MANAHNNDDEEENLLTPTSLALSLAPPRAPPFHSAQRASLVGRDPSKDAPLHHYAHHTHHHHHHHHKTKKSLERERKQLLRHLKRAHDRYPSRLPHPHLSEHPTFEGFSRWLGTLLPMHWFNHFRDSGGFRSTADGLVKVTIPSLALVSPRAVWHFLHLTSKVERFRYGLHPMNTVDMLLPTDEENPKGLVFFIHGGAWGSGLPWMYRLASRPFLEMKWAVAVVGYRTYPDTNVAGQVADLEQAAYQVQKRFSNLCQSTEMGTILVGHSSGAHIGLLMILERARRRLRGITRIPMEIKSFVGISGPYDICHHFDYEAARGVEELSPMKPAAGLTRREMKRHSPAPQMVDLLKTLNESTHCLDEYLPDMLLVHGIEDSTVPFTATAEAARIIKSCGVTKCTDLYLAKTEHQQAVMELMLGGKTPEKIVEWLQRPNRGGGSSSMAVQSKL